MIAASQPRQSLRRDWRSGLLFVAFAALLALAGVGGFLLGVEYQPPRQASLPILGTTPDYVMTNQLGEKVSAASLRGKVQLVTFLFPYCTTLCPLIAAHLADLEKLGLAPAGIADKVAIVSFDVDPANTGPAQMRAFLRQYGWDPHDRHWQYLVAPPAEMRRVVSQGFSVWYKRVSLADEAKSGSSEPAASQPEVVNPLAAQSHADYDVVHNDRLELVDAQGRIRRIYDAADTVGWQDLLAQIQQLLAQQR